jgi:potassium-transporting ATPase KdpC subunit
MMKTQALIALKILGIMTILTGVLYPLLMTGIAQVVFPVKASGSLVWKDGSISGSALIGQQFDSSIYFWSRPSAVDYNPVPSGGSNSGPSSEKLKKLVTERRAIFKEKNFITDSTAVPKEMIFASASGLDPHISPEAALLQVERVAASRNFTDAQNEQLIQLIHNKTEGPQFSLLGERRINVFELNLDLDKIR